MVTSGGVGSSSRRRSVGGERGGGVAMGVERWLEASPHGMPGSATRSGAGD